MSDLQQHLADLSPERRRLLDLLIRQKSQLDPTQPRPLSRSSGVNTFPLSFAQQRLWFLDQFQPENAAYTMTMGLRLHGPLDIAALTRTLNEVVRRHESLRTTFVLEQGQPVQAIAPSLTIPLPIADLTGLPADEHEAIVQRLVEEAFEQPFDLQRGPLFRAALFQLGVDEHIVLLTMHHIIADGWSTGVLLREVAALYRAHTTDPQAARSLPELPIQYADFAQWQRDWLQGEQLEEQLGYWRRQLANLPKLLLPTDRPRAPEQRLTSGRQTRMVSPALLSALNRLSQREGATLFQTLLTAFQILLQRYTGQDDIVVGSGIANRNRAEIEPLIGFFVNTLVLRADLSGNPTFREALHHVREVTLAAYAHQNLPFEKLVEELQPERDLSAAPLFQVSFVLQNVPLPTLHLPPLTIEPLEFERSTAKLDLSLSIVELDEGLRLRMQYNAELFDAETIMRMLGHFEQLLAGIVDDPEQRITRLPLLPTAEYQQIVHDWNATEQPYPADQCFQAIFEAHATRTPDAIAVAYGETQLTYAELDRRANQLAHHLQTLGVGPEIRVGLCMDRSLDLIVGLLGILKAGGAYVPLDPAYPPERLQFMLHDAQLTVLVTQANLHAALPDHTAQVICLDHDWSTIARRSDLRPRYMVAPENAAYIIYTSGSTGRPKGVLVTQRGLGNLALVQRETIGIRATSRVLQFASFSFDSAVWEVVMALLHGATLVMAPDDLVKPGPDLVQLLRDQAITALTLPPSALAVLAHGSSTPNLPALEHLLVAGEACSSDVVARWASGRYFFNGYGPTETTVCAALGLLDGTEHTPPIGRPIANTRIYLLDVHMQPVPVGVAGEVYISSVGLARGYHNRPELTAAAFVPDPFSAHGGARLYRAGDLARYRADGQIEFLGRIDHQVKLRGYRIELGEIEAALRQHPHIRETAVIVREDTPGNQRLVAYVVENNEPGTRVRVNTEHRENQDAADDGSLCPRGNPVLCSPQELRTFLQERLPAYMVPSAFVVLPELPLTPNGKLDRKALPVPDADHRDLEQTFVAPRTPTEELIASVWETLLDVHPIGIHDNFFALGGHSLLATQAISRLRQLLGLDLPLRLLFEAPSVAAFAARLSAQRADESLALLPVPRDGSPLPLSFAQQRLWFLDQLQPGSALYTIPFAVRLIGNLQHQALQQSLSAIVARHEVLRTSFAYDIAAEEPEPWQRIAPPSDLPLPVITLPPTADEHTIRALVQAEIQRPFDLQRGPLLRAALFQQHPDEYILTLVVHHIVFDGWSQGVLIQELTALYRGLAHDQPVTLPELPIQYADYALWQRRSLTPGVPGAALALQLDYWRRQLADLTTLELPTDYPRSAELSNRGAITTFYIPAALSADLQQLSQRLGATLFMTLLAAWQVLLARSSAQTDIAVGTPIAGRVRPELEPLIGFFVNTLVLRTDLTGAPSFAEVVDRVRRVCLAAYAQQDLPFELLVEALHPQRDLSRSPLFQVMFTLQNTPRTAIDLPDLTLEPLAVENHTAKFDLSLTLGETPNGLYGTIEYRADLFQAATIEQMAQRYQRLLAAVAADAEQRIDRLPLLTEPERQQLLDDWHTAQPLPEITCVHQLFEARAARAPEAIAVQYEDHSLSYAQLNERANQFAHHLQSLGVGPETRVGVALPRSLDLLVALLGILKAGGAYVPLDPSYPPERLQFMLVDAQVAVLVTQEVLLTALPVFTGAIVCVERAWPQIAQQPTTPPITTVQPDHLMYVIYTSGSTGTPKGVLLTHLGLLNYIITIRDRYILTPADRVLQFASISFDASIEELFVPLANGAAVVLRTNEMLASPDTFAATCARWQITVLSLPTAFWQFLVGSSADDEFTLPPSVRLLIMGGEHAALARVRQWQARYGERVELVNLYGPTEATIAATGYCVPAILPADLPTTPIGQPLANVQVYVLDTQLQPVPIGVVGELYIGGVALARGYHQQPNLTAATFVPDPFSDTPGARLYRTGDLGRRLRDGTLLFLGRVDQQIKLRGFRIELGEIEAALRRHAAVREAVVVVREDIPGDKRLVAYVVANTEQRNREHRENQDAADDGSVCPRGNSALCSPQELWQFLQERLPSYMVPATIMVLDALPMTSSDKVDRCALPAPDAAAAEAESPIVAPRDQWESWLAQLWAKLLNRPVVGINENFFELGGHSLLAVRMIAHIQRHSGQAIPLATLLQTPTIQQLALYLRQQQEDMAWSSLVALEPRGSQPPLFLIHPIGGTVLCYADLTRQLGPDQPVYGLQARGVEPGQTPHRSVVAMAAEYLAAIRGVQPRGPYRLGGWSFGGVVAFEIARQLQQQDEEIELLALIDSLAPDPGSALPDDAAILDGFIRDLGGLFGTSLGIAASELMSLPADERLSFILDHARSQGVVPPDIDLAHLRQLADLFHANLIALHSYTPSGSVDRIALIEAGGLNEPASPLRLATGWRRWAGHVIAQRAQGTHYSLLRQPQVQSIAAWLKSQFSAAQPAARTEM